MYHDDVEQDSYPDGGLASIARPSELPGCLAQGDTVAQAMAALDEACQAYLDSLMADGLARPVPLAVRLGATGAALTIRLGTGGDADQK